MLYHHGVFSPVPCRYLIMGYEPGPREETGAVQTVCILCPRTADDRLREQFFRAGAVRITSPEHMSLGYRGEPHDGEMSMRRYVKRVSVEIP